MDPMTLVITAMSSIQLLLANPLLGGSGRVNSSEASELLGLLGALLQQGDDACDDLVAFTDAVTGIADANRAPSPSEWVILRAHSEEAHDQLQAVEDEPLDEEDDDDDPTPTSQPISTPEATTEQGSGDDETVAPV